jgi:hypothetical protein
MHKVIRAGLSRRFTTITVSYTQAEELLKLKGMGDEDIYFYRKDADANRLILQKLKAESDKHVEDLGLTIEVHRLCLLDVINKHHVRIPEVALEEILRWRTEQI